MKKFGDVLWGLVFIFIGLVIGCNAIGITNINVFFDGWWTLFIIVPCFIGLFKDNEKTGNFVGVLIGVALLLACNDILDFDLIWKLAFPAVLVIIGLSIIFKDAFGRKVSKEIKKLNDKRSDENSCCATFSSQNIKYDDEKFTGSDLTAIFGGVKCDLREAKIDKDVVINVYVTFGGIDILVPENVKIKVKSTSIFGGIDNKAKENVDSKSPTIYINGTVLFGGVEIK